MEPAEVVVQEVPTCWRWVSSTTMRPGGSKAVGTGEDVAMEGESAGAVKPAVIEDKKMVLSFSVPASILPPPPEAVALDGMDVDVKQEASHSRPKTNASSLCDVDGCGKGRKYRLVKNWERGACGMEHLRVLEVG